MKHDLAVIFKLFAGAARLQRRRATLTIAAIAWGTVAILLLLAFGEGLKRQLSKNQRAMGENIAVIWPGETSKTWKGLPAGRPIRPTIDDVDFVAQRLPELAAVVGEVRAPRTTLTYGRKTVSGRVIGVSWRYGETRKHYAQAGGRFLSPADEAEKRRVIFLGNELARDLFGKEPAVGKTLLVNNSPYTVIGVMQKKIQMGMYGGPDANHAVIPITTCRGQFGREQLSNLLIQVKRPHEMKGALKRVHGVLAAKYQFDPTDGDRALGAWDTVKSNQVTLNVLIGIEAFLGVIGTLTLLIGGVGVANIMYAVVKERTREIGVKMALGARRAWIVGPFVLEGLLYTLIGGAAGLVLATLIVAGLALVPTEGVKALEFMGKPVLSIPIGLATAGILGLIGLAAGYFPARRAAAVDPASTLRYE